MILFATLLLNVIMLVVFDAPISHIVMIFIAAGFVQGAMTIMREERGDQLSNQKTKRK